MPAAYRDRLRLEGATLAAAGAACSAALLAAGPAQVRRWPLNTVAQLLAVAGFLAARGPRAAAAWMDAAQEVTAPERLSGEPTPLHHVPVPMLGGAAFVVVAGRLPVPLRSRAGWDAALRVTAGSALVGLFQALVLAPLVGRRQRTEGRVYLRLPGSSLTGTRLGYVRR